MKDALGAIIYVGKAKNLKRRLASYFSPARSLKAEPKTRALIASIADFDYYIVRSNKESLILESKLIKEWRPRYNISLKDDKRFYLLRAREGATIPRLELTRLRQPNGGRYWGPFPHSGALHATLEWLNREFQLRTCSAPCPNATTYKHCHADIIKQCSAPCIGRINPKNYQQQFEEAVALLEGKGRRELLLSLEQDMHLAAQNTEFERAAELRDIWQNLSKTLEPARQFRSGRGLPSTVRPLEDLAELGFLLELSGPPEIMECFDISNVSSNHIVASMVRFRHGSPDSSAYRRYRIKTVEGQNDFASMAEVVQRRYGRLQGENASMPQLIIVDGGKGQLSAAYAELEQLGLAHIPLIGLAKQHEEIFFPQNPISLRIPHELGALKLLQRIRDEAHRFANNYNEVLLRRRMTESQLDECPGISPKRKELLLAHFHSVPRLKKASAQDIAQVKGISLTLAANIVHWFQEH